MLLAGVGGIRSSNQGRGKGVTMELASHAHTAERQEPVNFGSEGNDLRIRKGGWEKSSASAKRSTAFLQKDKSDWTGRHGRNGLGGWGWWGGGGGRENRSWSQTNPSEKAVGTGIESRGRVTAEDEKKGTNRAVMQAR